jgi:4-hydroxymandelate oxidase
VESALGAGARAIVLTADTPVVGRKYAAQVLDLVEPGWLRVNFPEGDAVRPGLEKAKDLGPQDIAWLSQEFGVPVVVKGVLHPDDARRCVEAGAAAVWVSNHGGRQLDGTVSTADALAAVVDEVDGRAEVYVDGGVRRGGHGLVAAALGARGVFLGRTPMYALAEGGSEGVARALTELREELVEALRLAGATRPDAVPRTLLSRPCAM